MSVEKKEKIAVCIPTYNQAQYIELTIKSALSQVGPFEIEIWVSDDASTDNTEEVMKRLCRQDKRIHYYKHPKNIGIAENRSWVLSQPETEFVVNLDSDDILKKEFLLNLVPKIRQHPTAGYAHAQCETIDQNGSIISNRKLFRDAEFIEPENALKESIKGLKTTCSIILFRKKALEETNYTKNRPTYVEDYDLTVRLADLGYGNVYIKKILSQYRIWSIKGKTRNNKNEQIEGLCRIFEESIITAFKKREWDLKEVNLERKNYAINHSLCLVENKDLSSLERQKTITLLKRLGDSYHLRIRLFLYMLGLGRFFLIKRKIINTLKNQIKNVLIK